ncbi:MAG: hypothetical protein GTN69_08680 [Armatimonadetes bacterium]|nr:hypothetical protein [Armatimonadota bacterium]
MMRISRKTTLLALVVLTLFLLNGCGGRKPQESTADNKRETDGLLLPNWAPENPSPEFLRAAKVLKPIPEEVMPYTPLFPAAYEFFGTLSDEQIADFMKPKQQRTPIKTVAERGMRDVYKETFGAQEVGDEFVWEQNMIYLPVKSLTPAQRAAFENLFVASKEEVAGTSDDDLLVHLYKLGAEEDLSNVRIGFDTFGHMVRLMYFANVGEGRDVGGDICTFAQLSK